MKPIALLALLAALAVAGHWDIEQVDSAGWGDGVQMRRHPDGRLLLCYSDTSGRIRLASLDTAWHYENVPTESQPDPHSQAFDISSSGYCGITYCRNRGVRFVEKADSGWAEMSGYSSSWYRPLPAYRLDGTFSYMLYGGASVVNVFLDTAGWLAENIARSSMGELLVCWTNRTLSDGRQVSSITVDNQSLMMGGVFYCIRSGDSWTSSDWSLMMHEWASAVGCNADTSDSIRLCCQISGWYYGGFYYEGAMVDGGVDMSVLDIDTFNRPQIAYARPNLWYTYGDSSGWHNQEVDGRPVLALDMVLSESCQPIIAFANDSGVFLARGVDVAGQSEERQAPTTVVRQLTASVVRNVLLMPEASGVKPQAASLLDASGRKALDLKAGANDVSGLAPGVYFVREPQAQAVHKVVITR